MAIQFFDNKILFTSDGKIAMSSDCCCATYAVTGTCPTAAQEATELVKNGTITCSFSNALHLVRAMECSSGTEDYYLWYMNFYYYSHTYQFPSTFPLGSCGYGSEWYNASSDSQIVDCYGNVTRQSDNLTGIYPWFFVKARNNDPNDLTMQIALANNSTGRLGSYPYGNIRSQVYPFPESGSLSGSLYAIVPETNQPLTGSAVGTFALEF